MNDEVLGDVYNLLIELDDHMAKNDFNGALTKAHAAIAKLKMFQVAHYVALSERDNEQIVQREKIIDLLEKN